MKQILLAVILIFGAVFSAHAGRDIKDGNAYVKAVDTEQFLFEGNPLGKNMLLSSLQGLKDDGKITGVVLRDGAKASDQHKHLLKVIAEYLQIQAFSENSKQLTPLGE